MAQLEISVNNLRKNMIITRDVYTNTGLTLVAAGTPVTKDVITLLTKHFITSVAVEYIPITSGPLPPPPQKPKTVQEQLQEFQESFEIAVDNLSQNVMDIVYRHKDIDISLLLNSLNEIVEKADSETNLSNMLMAMKKNSDNLYQHSVSTAVFGQILGRWMDCSGEELELLGISGLLHDIGILKLSQEKLTRFSFHGLLDNSDRGKHAIASYNSIKQQHVDERIKQAVLTHHERLDGSGYPLKISHLAISKLSRILAIADTYDILTMNEEGIEALSPFLALQKLEEIGYNRLDSNCLMTFLYNIAETMIQHQVLLSNGKNGQIILINKYDISRPLVQVGDAFIDLSKRKEIFIREVYD